MCVRIYILSPQIRSTPWQYGGLEELSYLSILLSRLPKVRNWSKCVKVLCLLVMVDESTCEDKNYDVNCSLVV